MSRRDDEIAATVAAFAQRSAYWSQCGYHGGMLYQALASDPALPEHFDSATVAAILNVEKEAIAQRRKRGDPPSFIRVAQNHVLYPRHAFCLFLRDRFVDRRTPRAASEYTQVSPA